MNGFLYVSMFVVLIILFLNMVACLSVLFNIYAIWVIISMRELIH
jgi:hypothetical protein